MALIAEIVINIAMGFIVCLIALLKQGRKNPRRITFTEKILLCAQARNCPHGSKLTLQVFVADKMGISVRTVRRFWHEYMPEEREPKQKRIKLSARDLTVLLQLCKDHPRWSNKEIRREARTKHDVLISRSKFQRWRSSEFVKRTIK